MIVEEHGTGMREAGGPRRYAAAGCAGGAAVAFMVYALTLSWPTQHESTWIAVPERACGLLGIGVGVVVWCRSASPRLGQLAVFAGAAYYVQDLRASSHLWVFAIGFCFGYLWTAVFAQVLLSWPDGRLAGVAPVVLTAACYLLAVGSQVVRYLVDRPRPPWWYGIDWPVTTWTTIGSLLNAAVALVLLIWCLARWRLASPHQRSTAWPVWSTFVGLCALSSLAALSSAASAPVDVQAALIAVATGAGVLIVPTTWVSAAASARLVELTEAHRRAAKVEFDTRQQVQRDVHDGAQTPLFAAMLELDAVRERLAARAGERAPGAGPGTATPDDAVLDTLTRVGGRIAEARAALGRLTRGIYPATLEDFGLAAAVESLADQVRGTLQVTLDMPRELRFDVELERAMYFLIAEALTNTVKHAAATTLAVRLAAGSSHVDIDIRDDGRTPIRPGVIPWALQLRARSVGGAVTVDAPAAGGTRVHASLPARPAGNP
jgi:signal transduction histidine kinase